MTTGREVARYLKRNFREAEYCNFFCHGSLRRAQAYAEDWELYMRRRNGGRAERRWHATHQRLLLLKAQGRLTPDRYFTEMALHYGLELLPGFLDHDVRCEVLDADV